jgi:DNA primase
MRVALAPRVLVALDNDEAGDAASPWWIERLGERAERWTPERKDPGDMLREDGPAALRRWIADGLAVCIECGKDVDRYTPEGAPLCEYCYATQTAATPAAA